jgi:hypothetical protein
MLEMDVSRLAVERVSLLSIRVRIQDQAAGNRVNTIINQGVSTMKRQNKSRRTAKIVFALPLVIGILGAPTAAASGSREQNLRSFPTGLAYYEPAAAYIQRNRNSQGAVTFSTAFTQLLIESYLDLTEQELLDLIQSGGIEEAYKRFAPPGTYEWCELLSGGPDAAPITLGDFGATLSFDSQTTAGAVYRFERTLPTLPGVSGVAYRRIASPPADAVITGSVWKINMPGVDAVEDVSKINGKTITLPGFPTVVKPALNAGVYAIGAGTAQEIRWNNAEFANQIIITFVKFDNSGSFVGGAQCLVRNDGHFTVPRSIVSALPSDGQLSVGAYNTKETANAVGPRSFRAYGVSLTSGAYRIE